MDSANVHPGVSQGNSPEEQLQLKWPRRGGHNGRKRNAGSGTAFTTFPKYQDNRRGGHKLNNNNYNSRKFQGNSKQSFRPQSKDKDGNQNPEFRDGFRRRNLNRETKQQKVESVRSSEIPEDADQDLIIAPKVFPVTDDGLKGRRQWIASTLEFPAPFPPVKSKDVTSELTTQAVEQIPSTCRKADTSIDHIDPDRLSPTDEGIELPIETSSRNSSLSIRHSSGDDRESHVDADKSNISGYVSGFSEKMAGSKKWQDVKEHPSLGNEGTQAKDLDLESGVTSLVETLKIWNTDLPVETGPKDSEVRKSNEVNVNLKAAPGFGKPFKNDNQKPKRGRPDQRFCVNRQWNRKPKKDLHRNSPQPPPPPAVATSYPGNRHLAPFLLPIMPNLQQQQHAFNLASKGHFNFRPSDAFDPNLIRKLSLEQALTPKHMPSYPNAAHPMMPSNLYNRNLSEQQRPSPSPNPKDATPVAVQQNRASTWHPNRSYNQNAKPNYGPSAIPQPTTLQNIGHPHQNYIPNCPQAQPLPQNATYHFPGTVTLCQSQDHEARFAPINQADYHQMVINPYLSIPPPLLMQVQGQSYTPLPHAVPFSVAAYPFTQTNRVPETEHYHPSGTQVRNSAQIRYPLPAPNAGSEIQYHWVPQFHQVLPVVGDYNCAGQSVLVPPNIYSDPAIHRVIGPLTVDTRLAEETSSLVGSQPPTFSTDLLAIASPIQYTDAGLSASAHSWYPPPQSVSSTDSNLPYPSGAEHPKTSSPN